jgi:Eukaryotic translation initiation factor 3 subunit 7 (eIF-3)
MTLKYSVYPWDIFVTKRENQIIFDKAPENSLKTTYLELQTINENTSNDMKEDEKAVYADCEESTYAAINW